MDKTQLMEKINQMPSFVLRDVAINGVYTPDVQVPSKDWQETDFWKAVTESDKNLPLTFVTKKYKLLQFKDCFLPIIQNMPELTGRVIYWHGMAIMDVYPNDINFKIGNDSIGLVAVNSVNKQSSVIIKFCVKSGNRSITIPKKLAGFKRVHVGKVFEMTQNFIAVADKVKSIWNTIITEYSKLKMDESFATTVLETVELKDEFIVKKVNKKVAQSADMNLWDLFIYIIELIEAKDYISELHKQKKLDLIAEKMFQYAIASKLINA